MVRRLRTAPASSAALCSQGAVSSPGKIGPPFCRFGTAQSIAWQIDKKQFQRSKGSFKMASAGNSGLLKTQQSCHTKGFVLYSVCVFCTADWRGDFRTPAGYAQGRLHRYCKSRHQSAGHSILASAARGLRWLEVHGGRLQVISP